MDGTGATHHQVRLGGGEVVAVERDGVHTEIAVGDLGIGPCRGEGMFLAVDFHEADGTQQCFCVRAAR